MWQQLTVFAIVLVSAAYAVWSLLPATLRWRLRVNLAAALERAPPALASLGHKALKPGGRPVAGGCTACPASALRKAPASRR